MNRDKRDTFLYSSFKLSRLLCNKIKLNLLSSHLESYFNVLLKLYSFLPVVKLCRSVRKITVSAFVNSALVPENLMATKASGW